MNLNKEVLFFRCYESNNYLILSFKRRELERFDWFIERIQTRVATNALPFVTEYLPSVPNLKNIIMNKWHLIENQPLLREIFKDPPIISYKKGKSFQDILVRAKL